jgi:uncharacterized protein YkwD
MEGRILRRQADPKAQPRGAGYVVGKSAIRRMLGRAAAISAAALLLGMLTLVATSIAKVGVAPAKASSCRWADKGPRHVSRKHARHAVLCAINKQRRKHGLRHLKTRHALRKAGKRHSKYMERHRCFSHQCPGEADLVGRIERTSYLPCNCTWRVGETLAWGDQGSGTPHAIVRAWMNSPPHRAVILDGRLRNIGVGLVWGSPSNPGARAATYTADFGFKGR